LACLSIAMPLDGQYKKWSSPLLKHYHFTKLPHIPGGYSVKRNHKK
jgi:hypothetical protein